VYLLFYGSTVKQHQFTFSNFKF